MRCWPEDPPGSSLKARPPPGRTALPGPRPTQREERNAIAIASNEPFSGWTKTFTDPRLCAGILDRPTFNGHIIETATTSYRLAHTPAQRSGGGPDEAVTMGPVHLDKLTRTR